MKRTPTRFSLGGKLLAVMLALAMLAVTAGDLSVLAGIHFDSDITKSVEISEQGVKKWIRDAGDTGLSLDAGLLRINPEVEEGSAAGLVRAVQEQIDAAGVLIRQQSLGDHCALFVAARPDGEGSAEGVTLIGFNGNADQTIDFVAKVTGEHFYAYQATFAPFSIEAVPSELPEENRDPLPEETFPGGAGVSAPETENGLSSQPPVTSGTGEAESAPGESVASSAPETENGLSSQPPVTSGTGEAESAPGESAASSAPEAENGLSSQPPVTSETGEAESAPGESAASSAPEAGTANEPAEPLLPAEAVVSVPSAAAWNGTGVYLAANMTAGLLRAFSEEAEEPYAFEYGVTEEASVELTAEDLEELRKNGYPMHLDGAGLAMLGVSINPSGSPFTLAESLLGADAGSSAVASVTVASDRDSVPTGEPFVYTVSYKLNSIPVFKYSDSEQLPLFQSYDGVRIELQLPKGIAVLSDGTDPGLDISSDGLCTYDLGTVSASSSGSFQVKARMIGNGAVFDHTAYPAEGENPSARILADVTVHDYTGGGDVTKDYSLGLRAPEYPTVYSVAEDTWVLKKSLIKDAEGGDYTVDGDEIVLNYKIEVGLSDDGGETGLPTGDAEKYQRFGRLNFDQYTLTDELPTFTRGGTVYRPVSSEIRYMGEGYTLDAGGEGKTSLTVTEYKTKGYEGFIDGAPAYTAYQVTVRYRKSDLQMEFNDPDREKGILLTNTARLDYALEGEKQVTRISEVPAAIQYINDAAILRIHKKIGLDGAAQTYGESLERDFPGYAAFEVKDSRGDAQTVYVNPTMESGEPERAKATGDNGFVSLQLVPGTYTVTEIGTPGFTDFPAEKSQTVTIPAGETKDVSFNNPIKDKGFLAFEKKAVDAPGAEPKALGGAEFGLYKAEGYREGVSTPIATASSAADGTVHFSAEPGSYFVRELSVPEGSGYLLDKKSYSAVIRNGEIASLEGVADNALVNYANKGRLIVEKYVYTNGRSGRTQRVPDGDYEQFAFTLEQKPAGAAEDGWKAVGTYSLKLSNGATSFTAEDLPLMGADGMPYEYRVVETKAAPQYGAPEGTITKVPALESCGTVTVKINNTRKGRIALEKRRVWRDAANGGAVSDEAASGVAFQLYRKNPDGRLEAVGASANTGNDGRILLDGLEIADAAGNTVEYFWRELSVPEGFQLMGAQTMMAANGVEIDNVIPAGHAAVTEPAAVRVENVSARTLLKVEKWNGQRTKRLAGAEFKLERLDAEGKPTGEPVLWTSSDSGAEVLAVEPGTYRVTETKAPEGYSPYWNPAEGKEKGKTWQTVTIPGWTTAEGYKAEGAAPALVFKNYAKQTVTLSKMLYRYNRYDSADFVNNSEDFSSAVFHLYREGGSGLERVTGITYQDGNTVLTGDEIIVKAGKSVSIKNLENGTYYLKEVSVTSKDGVTLTPSQVPDAYVWVDGSLPNWVQRDGAQGLVFGPVTVSDINESNRKDQNKSLTAIDFQNYSAMRLVKESAADGKKLSGATFHIEGSILVGNMEEAVSISRTVLTNTQVKKNGEKVAATTGADGTVIIDRLPIYALRDGVFYKIKYTAKEVTAPEGYALNNQTASLGELLPMQRASLTGFTAKGYSWEGGRNTLTFQNEPFASLTVRKVGRDLWSDKVNGGESLLSDVRLSGVELALYKAEGTKAVLVRDQNGIAVTQSTDAFGQATFTELDNHGRYYVVEVSAPDGYELPGKTVGLLRTGGELPAELAVSDLESGVYNFRMFDFGKAQPELDKARPQADLTGDPLVNVKGWAQFEIAKYEAGTGKPLDGARFVLRSAGAPKETTLAALSALIQSGGTPIGKEYESGAALTDKGGRQQGITHTDKLAYGAVYWIEEIQAPSGYLKGDAPITVFVPAELFEQLGRPVADAEWAALGVGAILPYEANTETKAVFTNEPDPESGGEGEADPSLYVKLRKVVYNSKSEMEADGVEAESGKQLGGVTFGLWLLNRQGNPIVKLDTMTTGLDFQASGISNQAVSNRIDLSRYADEEKYPDTSVQKQPDATYTARLRLIEESAPAGVVPAEHSYDLNVSSGGQVDETYSKRPIKNYLVRGYTLTVSKYGYTRKDGLNYQAASDTAGLNEDEWLDGKIPAGDRTPLENVVFLLQKKGTDGDWSDLAELKTNGQGWAVYSKEENGVAAGLEPGDYRLLETLPADVAHQYENTHARAKGGYPFTITNENKSITLFNPQKPLVRIVKNPRASFSENGSAAMSGARFQLKSAAGRHSIIIGNSGVGAAYVEQGSYTISEEQAPAGYTAQYAWMTDAEGNPLPANRITVGWNQNKWLSGNTVTVNVRDAAMTSLTIEKLDADTGELLSGAKFKVYRMDFRAEDFEGAFLKESLSTPPAGGQWAIVGTYETGIAGTLPGKALIANLRPGWYKIEEMKAPSNYSIAGGEKIVALCGDLDILAGKGGAVQPASPEGITVTVKNVPYDTLKVEKTFDRGTAGTSEPYPKQVTFNVYKKNAKGALTSCGKAIAVTISPGGTGEAEIRMPRLPEGEKYVLRESTAGLDHWMLDTSRTATERDYILGSRSEGTHVYTFTAVNLYAGVQATLKKVDAQSESTGLKGAGFEVYYQAMNGTKSYIMNGSDRAVFTSQADGTVKISFLLPLAVREWAQKDGLEFHAVETQAPAGYVLSGREVVFTLKPGASISYETTAGLTVKNDQGASVRLVKRDNIYGENSHPLKGVSFTLYRLTGEASAELVEMRVTDTNGELLFDHLPVGKGERYALYETLPAGYVRLESVRAETASGGEPFPVREVATKEGTLALTLLPEGFSAGESYSYAAYNLPRQMLTIQKSNAEPGGVVPTAKFSIWKADASGGKLGDPVAVDLTTKKESGQDYSSVKIALEPGDYVVEETWSSLQLDREDARLDYRKAVTLPEGRKESVVAFKNRKAEPEVSLKKDAEPERLEHSLLEERAEITYTLSGLGGNENQLPLDQYVVSDAGLSYYSTEDFRTGSRLDEAEYVDGKYTFTKLIIGAAGYTNYLRNYGGTEEGRKASALSVKITLTGFDGKIHEETRELPAEGLAYDVPEGVWKAFAVEYFDPALTGGGSGYALGQLFTAGDIQVEASLLKQAQGPQAKPVRGIRNTAEVSLSYRAPQQDGTMGAVMRKKAVDKADVKAPAPSGIPPVEVRKSSRVLSGSSLEIGGKLEYTITLKNLAEPGSGLTMKNPVLIDLLPRGVEVFANAYPSGRYTVTLPDGLTRDMTKRGSASGQSQDYLALWFSGELKPQETIEVKYQAGVLATVLIYGQTLTNRVQATSLEAGIQSAENPMGAAFTDAKGGAANRGDAEIADLFFKKDYGYVGYAATNTVAKKDSLQLLKRVTADKEPGFDATGGGTDSTGDAYAPLNQNARASVEGTVRYQLSVLNGGTQTYQKLRILDMLPNVNDYSLEGASYPRYTAWTPTYGKILKVEQYTGGARKQLSTADYTVYYNTQMFGKNKLPAADAMMKAEIVSGDGWTTTPPADMAEVKAVVLEFEERISLPSDSRLVVTMEMEVPAYSEFDDVYDKLAVNTFSASSVAGNSKSRSRLTSNFVNAILEPENVGVGGHVWIDKNDNGFQDDEQLPTDGLPKVNVALQVFYGSSNEPSETYQSATDENGEFIFKKLSPSAGDSKYTLDQLYDGENNLLPGRLRGNKTSYRLVITPPEGFGLAKSFAPTQGVQTKSTNPAELMADQSTPKDVLEARDSNFIRQNGSYISERFYLWPGGLWDLTKDLGLVRTRSLQIHKTNPMNQPIEGASFELYGPFDSVPTQAMISRAVPVKQATDVKGKALFEDLLFYKYYAVVEAAPGGGYTLAGASGTGDLLEKASFNGKPSWILHAATQADLGADTSALSNTLAVTNQPASGKLELSKLDAYDNTPLAGARFKLTGTSKAEGGWEAYIGSLARASGETGLVNGAVDVNVSENSLFFTTAGGTVSISGLPYGSYRLEEVSAPEGYALGSPAWSREFTIETETGEAFTGMEAVRNERITGSLSIEKVDALDPSKKLSGARFALSLAGDAEDSAKKGFWEEFGSAYATAHSGVAEWNAVQRILTVTVGAEGLTLNGLPAAKYSLAETAPPAGYSTGAPAWKQSFSISEETPNVSFAGEHAVANEPLRYTLKKVDALTGKPLPGAFFTVKSADGKTSLFTLTTGTDGTAEFTATKLAADTEYLLVETTAPQGYQAAPPVPFRLDADGRLAVTQQTPKEASISGEGLMITLPNTLMTGSLTVKKVVDGENLLPDHLFHFRLTKPDGTVESFALKAGGEASFDGLPLGAYQIEELPDDSFAFVRFEGGEENIPSLQVELTERQTNAAAVAHNRMNASGTLSVEKQLVGSAADVNDQFAFQLLRTLDGGLTWEDVGAPARIKAGETHTFTALALGVEYMVVEREAGAEYRLAGIEAVQNGAVDAKAGGYRFTPTANAASGKAKFINERKLGALNLLKYRSGSPGVYVDGAAFELYRFDAASANSRGEKVAFGSTANGGRLSFTNLPSGRYVLVETYAPRGYYVLKTQFIVTLTVSAKGDSLTVSLPAEERVAVLEGGVIRIPNSYGPTHGGGSGGGGGNNFFETLVEILEDPIPLTDKLMEILEDDVPLASLPNILPTSGGFPFASFGVLGLLLAACGMLLKRKAKKEEAMTES